MNGMINKLTNKAKTFWHILKNSVASPEYYQDLITHHLSYSAKFYITFAVMTSLFLGLVTTFKTAPAMQNTISEFLNNAKDVFPSDVELVIKDGTFELNQPQPYIIPLPDDLKKILAKDVDMTNLIVIDKAGTIEDMQNYKTLALMNEKNLIINDPRSIQVYPLSNFPEGTLDQQAFNSFVDGLWPLARVLPILGFFALFLRYVVYLLVLTPTYILFVALVYKIIGAIMNLDLEYKRYYQIGLHTVTVPVLIETLSVTLGLNIAIPLWFLGVHFVLVGYILFKVLNNNNYKN
jgi:hypothetical protein